MTGTRPDTMRSAVDKRQVLRPFGVVDSASVERQRRAEYYRSYFSSCTSERVPFSPSVPNGDFQVRTESWRFNGLAYASGTLGALTAHWNIHRRPTANHGLVMVRMLMSGKVTGMVNGENVVIGPGDVYIMGFDCKAVKIQTDCEFRGFYLPYSALNTAPGQLPMFRHIPVNSPVNRLMTASMNGFADGLTELLAEDAQALTNGLTSVFAALLAQPGADLDRAELEPTRFAAIKDYIDRAAPDTQISADRLCREFHVSRATLYRMFSDVGGVASFVTERRLLAVYRELSRTPEQRGVVRRAAERWGFHDAANFSRAFRRQFGMTPSEILFSDLSVTTAAERTPGTTDGSEAFWKILDLS